MTENAVRWRTALGTLTLVLGLTLLGGACSMSSDDGRPEAAQQVLDTGRADYDLTRPSEVTRADLGMEDGRRSMGIDYKDADVSHFDTTVRLPDELTVHEQVQGIGAFSMTPNDPPNGLSLQLSLPYDDAPRATERAAEALHFDASQVERVRNTIGDAASQADDGPVRDAFMEREVGGIDVAFEVRIYKGADAPVAITYGFDW